MDLLNVMLKRRSIRNYKNEAISKEKLDNIIASALLAPTSRNRNPCKFYIIKSKKILEKISKVKISGSQFLENADVGIAVFADENISDTWIEDSSIALTYMHLMATEQDVGSCWIQLHMRKDEEGRDAEDNAREILDISDNYRIVGIMALGIAEEPREGKTLDDLDYEKVKIID